MLAEVVLGMVTIVLVRELQVDRLGRTGVFHERFGPRHLPFTGQPSVFRNGRIGLQNASPVVTSNWSSFSERT